MGTLIRATNLWGYADLVRELGADPGPLLDRFAIAPGVERQDDAFMSLEGFVGLLAASARELDCPDFGLRLSRWQGLDILGPIAVIARNASTLRDGMESIGRYLYVHSPALELDVASSARALRFTYRITESLPELEQGYELSMANGARMVRLLGGLDSRPSLVSFLHEQLGSDAAYAEALGCPVRFGQPWCGFELPLGLAARPIDNADPETRRIATKYLQSQYLPSEATLADHAAALARRLLPTGQCSVDAIAEQLGMHPRTLQRRLALDGTSCQEVIDRERREQAVRYLADPRFQLGQIAGLLGYAEQSTLNRSCQRWFGTTPGEYRAATLRSRSSGSGHPARD